jgi:2-keto-4-pentenoate hydratase/2-oxohepta-3-ene-1,7-dioic acid hydratase in catechol pathway
MKLASYLRDGGEAFGIVVGDGLVTLSRRTAHATMRDALAANALGEIARLAGEQADTKLSEVRFRPVVTRPEKIICVGINYRDHAEEAGREISPRPSVFARFADTLIGHEEPLVRPKVSECFDFEGELAVVIGRGGRHISQDRALDHVAGYTCFVDGSVRDYQKNSVTAGKNFPATGPLGPWLVTTDEIPDPSQLTLTTRVNGREMQRSGTDRMIYSIAQIIAYVSDFTPLAPGDVIATGTPSGVGHSRKPPLWMKAGDVLEVEISRIGTLRNRVVDE